MKVAITSLHSLKKFNRVRRQTILRDFLLCRLCKGFDDGCLCLSFGFFESEWSEGIRLVYHAYLRTMRVVVTLRRVTL